MTHRTDHAGRDGRGLLSTSTTHHDFSILGTVPVGVLVLQADTSPVYANEAARGLFGDLSEATSLSDILCPTDGRDLNDHIGESGPFEAIVAGSQMHRQVMVSVARMTIEGADGFVLSMTDVTALKRETERAEFLAHHDPLTRLGNRTLLQSVWDTQEDKLRAGAVEVHAMALDLDRFKEVNDVYGHAIGDMVLRQAADRMRMTVGEAGHAFRFGGDEFFVLADDLSRDEALALGREIIANLGQPMTVLSHDISIGCSIGIASGPLDGCERDALHRAADLALYDVKRAGRNDVAFFDPRQEQAILHRRLLQTDFLRAFADDGLDLTFRPQFDSVTGKMDGAEASIRWTNARTGQLIDPADVSILAEETGLAHLLDLWAIRTAVARFAAGRESGWNCSRVAVTIGAATLLRPDTADAVTRILAEHDLPPDRLELQIAEALILSAGNDLLAAIASLGKTGARIVIDGFCADRPDLRYLRSLGVERVKFDRKVAERMLGDADAEALIGSIWTLCRTLGIEMSADGVESAEHWARLRGLGRMRAQGSFFEEVEAFGAATQRRAGPEASG